MDVAIRPLSISEQAAYQIGVIDAREGWNSDPSLYNFNQECREAYERGFANSPGEPDAE